MLRFHAAYYISTLLTATATDTASAADSVAGRVALTANPPDSVATTDTAGRTTTRTRTSTDAATITDTARVTSRTTRASDTATVTDTAATTGIRLTTSDRARADTGGRTVWRPAVYARLTTLLSPAFKTAHPYQTGIGIMVKWIDWETPGDNQWSESFETSLRAALDDAHNRDYYLVVRIEAGSASPVWLWDLIKVAYCTNVEGFGDPLQRFPIPDDAVYVDRYNRMLDRLASIMAENVPGTSVRRDARVSMVTASGPTGVGSEQTLGYGKPLETAHGTVGTLSAAFLRGHTTLSLSADPGSDWPTTSAFLVRVGATWVNENDDNRGAYNFPVVFDNYENRTTSAGALGISRNGYTYITSGGAGVSLTSVNGGTLHFAYPAAPQSARTCRAFLNARSMADGDYEIEFTASSVPAVDGNWSISVIGRGQGSTPQDNCLMATLRRGNVNTSLAINRRLGGTETTIAPFTNIVGLGLAAGEVWVIRLRLETVNTTDIRCRAKAWKKSEGEPTDWFHDVTDVAPGGGLHLAGLAGVHGTTSATNDTAVDLRVRHLIAGPIGPKPFFLKVTRSGTTLTVVDSKDWSGTFACDQPSAVNVHYVNDSNVENYTFDGETGPRSPTGHNFGAWELIIPGEVVRRDRYRDAWARNIDKHVSTFPSTVRTGLAAGVIFRDAWARANQLAQWAGNRSSTLGAVAGEAGSAPFQGTLPPGGYGKRMLASTTNLRHTTDWAANTTDDNVLWLRLARDSGWSIKLHTAAIAALPHGDPLIQAMENALEALPMAEAVETSENRWEDNTLNTSATANYKGWTGGSGRNARQYLVADLGSLNNRLPSSPVEQNSTHPRTTTDTATVTDTAGRATVRTRTASDSAVAADSTISSGPSTTDAATVTDTAERTTVRTRTTTDSEPSADTAERTTTRSRSTTDTAGAVDTVAGTTVGTRTVTETAATTDTAARAVSRPRTATDAAPVADTAGRTAPRTRTATDSAATADTATPQPVGTRTVTDSGVTADAAPRTVSVARSSTDTASTADVATGARIFARVTVDTAPTADAATGTITTITESNVSAWVRAPVPVGPVVTVPVPVGSVSLSRPVPILTTR